MLGNGFVVDVVAHILKPLSNENMEYRMIAEALMCMALNIYHEARNQSIVGQIAVAKS